MVAVERHPATGNVGRSALSLPPDPAAQQVAAGALLDTLMSDPWGQITPSIYETGRLVTLAPWLEGHRQRVEFLLANQRPDGAWGSDDEYGLVPTLSATEALLSTARQAGSPATARAAGRGLDRLFGWLADPSGYRAPDTPAIELIVPALVEAVNRHLDELADRPVDGALGRWPTDARLRPPAGLTAAPLTALRSRLAGGATPPTKLLHSLEVATVGSVDPVRPVGPGTVGASPAATAAWLAGGPADAAAAASARGYLVAVTGRYGGPVPSVVPIAPFERAWVLNLLLDGGFRLAVPGALVDLLAAPLGPGGMSGGAGLPPDADTTSATLRALARIGAPAELDCLRSFETDTHFCTWPGERTASTTTNAHVLDAFGHRAAGPGRRPGDRAVIDKLCGWLAAQQLPDGSWLDKWHASPYYATVSCALALHRFGGVGDGARASAAVRRARRWTVDTQRPDGSWGRWQGTVEETAYAVQTLLLTAPARPGGPDRAARAAAVRGLRHLASSFGDRPDPPLWHDKDLYAPTAIVRAAALAAFRLGTDRRLWTTVLARRSTAAG